MTAPQLIISLDFELGWGSCDRVTNGQYDDAAVEQSEAVVPAMLERFEAHDIHTTWAMIGAIACDGWDEWHTLAPPWPRYANPALGFPARAPSADPKGRRYFAPELVDLVRADAFAGAGLAHVLARLHAGARLHAA